jgi:uncharacterized protein
MFDNNKNPLIPAGEDIRKFIKIVSVFVMVLSLFIAVLVVNASKSFRYIGTENPPYATVSFSGEGEVFAVPDTASFTFGVTAEASTADEAQSQVSERMNSIISALQGKGIERGDIKTVGYNLYPRYEYREAFPDGGAFRTPSTRILVGYEASHSVSVKVKDIDEAGATLAEVGGMGVSNISSLNFTLGDEESVKSEARKIAIDDAKRKARSASRDLGVRLVRIVDFYEDNGGYFPMHRLEMMDSGMGGVSAPPDIPVGENRIFSRVTITYEIR